MNAYELADKLQMDKAKALLYVDSVIQSAAMLRQQAEKISNMEQWEKRYIDRILELEKNLHMVQRHYDQLDLPDGYVVVCVHCAKELKIEFDEPDNELEYYKIRDRSHIKIIKAMAEQTTKYEQVLQSIANEHIELSHDKIKWQCEDHIRWAKEALSSSGNNSEDVSNPNETLPKGKE